MIQALDASPQAVDRMASALDETLTRAGLSPNIETHQQVVARDQSEFQEPIAIFYAVAVIIALVGILGLLNTLTISVFERRREIGILRSMGGTGWSIASVFWIEGMSLATIAWIAAVILGIPAAYALVCLIRAVLLPLPFTFHSMDLVVMLILTIIIATLASFGPVLKASWVRIADTLHYE